VYASQLDHRRLIKDTLAHRAEYVIDLDRSIRARDVKCGEGGMRDLLPSV
jgi:hypothetical protein